MQITRNIALLLLRGYKLVISPWLPASCRYVPTCSEYAMEAIDRYGILRGSGMALRRILRCHPFVQGGYDPVAGKSAQHSRPKDNPRRSKLTTLSVARIRD